MILDWDWRLFIDQHPYEENTELLRAAFYAGAQSAVTSAMRNEINLVMMNCEIRQIKSKGTTNVKHEAEVIHLRDLQPKDPRPVRE